MNRSVEILEILRQGMESVIDGDDITPIKYTRIFNFEERRVSLRMEVLDDNHEYLPVGKIDVLEIPTNNGRVSCSCTLSEMKTGKTQRVMLRLKNSEQKEQECEKVLSFFRDIFPVNDQENNSTDQGFPLSSRGAHSQNQQFTD